MVWAVDLGVQITDMGRSLYIGSLVISYLNLILNILVSSVVLAKPLDSVIMQLVTDYTMVGELNRMRNS